MYLFILCPPFSGSTILYKILNTSSNISTFLDKKIEIDFKGEPMTVYIHKGEGQFLYEMLGNHKLSQIYSDNRHNPDFQLPLDSMNSIWKEHWNFEKPIQCEKSPPFVHFANQIESFYGKENTKFIVMIRNPYACRWNEKIPNWNVFASKQKQNLETLKHTLLIRYEDLVTEPELTKQRLIDFIPELHDINIYVEKIQGLSKGARNQRITTEFRDRILDKEIKNTFLDKDLLIYFGYEFLE